MSVVLIDAFDSFVYIVDQYLSAIVEERTVLRSHESNIERIEQINPRFLVLGPGPGHPDLSGHVQLVEHFAGQLPILGVCLGHQAIGAAFGAMVAPAEHVMHGKVCEIRHDFQGVYSYEDAPTRTVARYHSLIITDESVPDELEVTSRSVDDDYIMGVRHRSLPIEGVQYHPESIGTDRGMDLFRGFYETHVK
jgi:anthranilate synthase component 2